MTTLSKEDEYRAALERIIRPIVEGQIRGFIKEHPSILQGVDWYKKPGRDCAEILCNSLSKRIIRDLVCGSSAARLAAALVALRPALQPSSAVASPPAEKAPELPWVVARAFRKPFAWLAAVTSGAVP